MVPPRFRLYRSRGLACPAAPQPAGQAALAATAMPLSLRPSQGTGGVPAVPGPLDGAVGQRATSSTRRHVARPEPRREQHPSERDGDVGARRPRHNARRKDAGDGAQEIGTSALPPISAIGSAVSARPPARSRACAIVVQGAGEPRLPPRLPPTSAPALKSRWWDRLITNRRIARRWPRAGVGPAGASNQGSRPASGASPGGRRPGP